MQNIDEGWNQRDAFLAIRHISLRRGNIDLALSRGVGRGEGAGVFVTHIN